jgi:predicted PolB exonuclease-like 3'-5' exonuclease
MFTPTQLEKFLFFDIETSGLESNYERLSEKMQELWSKRSEILRNQLGEKYPDNKDKSDSDLFELKSALQAEFGRVVCISFGKIKFVEDEPTIQIISVQDEDESVLLKKAFDIIIKMSKIGVKLIGHNVKRFDIPFLCKRGIINSLELPAPLQVWDKKPWEISITDTSELWSFGAWQEGFASLDLLATVLGIDSPKEQMNGSEVHGYYYSGRIEEITEYCERDVITLAQILLRLSNLNLIDKQSIIFKK